MDGWMDALLITLMRGWCLPSPKDQFSRSFNPVFLVSLSCGFQKCQTVWSSQGGISERGRVPHGKQSVSLLFSWHKHLGICQDSYESSWLTLTTSAKNLYLRSWKIAVADNWQCASFLGWFAFVVYRLCTHLWIVFLCSDVQRVKKGAYRTKDMGACKGHF